MPNFSCAFGSPPLFQNSPKKNEAAPGNYHQNAYQTNRIERKLKLKK